MLTLLHDPQSDVSACDHVLGAFSALCPMPLLHNHRLYTYVDDDDRWSGVCFKSPLPTPRCRVRSSPPLTMMTRSLRRPQVSSPLSYTHPLPPSHCSPVPPSPVTLVRPQSVCVLALSLFSSRRRPCPCVIVDHAHLLLLCPCVLVRAWQRRRMQCGSAPVGSALQRCCGNARR
jgi:hypothetical protein